MNIIVASSDSVVRRSLADLLGATSNQVRTTPKSGELIRWALDGDFDAFVLDVDLVGMDGLETLSILKQVRPKVPVVMLSSDASPEVGRQIAEIGVFYHFVKPVNPSDMLQVIRAVEEAPSDGASKPF